MRASERALEKCNFSSNSCSFIVLFSSNDMLKWNTRASASGIVIFLEFDSFSLHFTQISFNSLNFWIISLKFLKLLEFLENFLEAFKIPSISLKQGKFLESGSTGLVIVGSCCSCHIYVQGWQFIVLAGREGMGGGGWKPCGVGRRSSYRKWQSKLTKRSSTKKN